MDLADFTENLSGQKMFQILAEAKKLDSQGKNIIHLEIGDPNFDTPSNVVKAAKAALDDGHTHYVQSSGLPELKEACRELTWRSRGFKPKDSQILVTSGANIQIYLAILSLINPGEEVIIPNPSFVSYSSIIKACRGIPVEIDLTEEDSFKIDPDKLRPLITKKTKAIIINSPHNPTGSVLTKIQVNRIYEIAEEFDLVLISDEVYGRMIFSDSSSGFHSPSTFDNCLKRVILVHSLSKTYAMTGWRIGAVTGPEHIISKMALLYETITSCTAPFVQYAAIEAMNNSNNQTYEMVSKYQARRDLIVDGLNKISGISCLKPEGSFYAFANIQNLGFSSERFSLKLLNNGYVASCPGIYFGRNGEGFVRFCFANSPENIEIALDRINSFIKDL